MNLSLPQIENWFRRFSLRQLTLLWYRYFKLFFTLLFFLVLGYGSYVWFHNLYRYTWTDAERQKYIETTFTQTNLKQADFEKTLGALKQREQEYQSQNLLQRNLFTGEPVINR